MEGHKVLKLLQVFPSAKFSNSSFGEFFFFFFLASDCVFDFTIAANGKAG